MIRLLAIDMDGTCLNSRNRIHAETMTWLRRARDQGVTLVPTTGRTLSCIPHQLKEERLYRYVITSNGASVTDLETGTDVFRAEIPLEAAVSLMEACEGKGLGMTAHIGHEYWVQGRMLSLLGRLRYGRDAASSQTVRHIIPYAAQAQRDVEELQFFFFSKAARRRTEQALAGYSGLAAAYSGSYVEIYSKAATKGTALAAVARQLSISKDEIACIGDGENDIPMFQEAGLRFAMGNAAPELKALADAVVASNNENGVAEAIRRILA